MAVWLRKLGPERNGGFAQHGDELAFISETGKLSTLKANGEIQEGNVEGLENIIAAYCDSQEITIMQTAREFTGLLLVEP